MKILIAVLLLSFSYLLHAADPPYKLLLVDAQRGDPYQTVRESMLAELNRLGYTEGENLATEYYSLSHYTGAAKHLWHHKIQQGDYDLVFTNGTLAALPFRNVALFSEQKFVFASVTDPVGLGLIRGFDEPPPANFTGVSYLVPVSERLSFVKKLFPGIENVGFIYADMPQSHSYNRWLKKFLAGSPDWQQIKFHFRKVDFIPSEGGQERMAWVASRYVQELDPVVDIFMSPHDQMGAQKPFPGMVYKTASKPLMGVGRKDVTDNRGAVASIYPSDRQMGIQVAAMIDRLLKGEPMENVYPEKPKMFGTAIDLKKAAEFGIRVPDELISSSELVNEKFSAPDEQTTQKPNKKSELLMLNSVRNKITIPYLTNSSGQF